MLLHSRLFRLLTIAAVTTTSLCQLHTAQAQTTDTAALFAPFQQTGNTISWYGKQVLVNKTGFPEQIRTFFTPDGNSIDTAANNFIIEPVHFHIVNNATHKDIAFTSQGVTYTQQQPHYIQWQATNISPFLQMEVNGSLELDGYLFFVVKLTALQNVNLDDIRYHLPFNFNVAKYVMAPGQKGGARPDSVKWTWNAKTPQNNGAWIGNVNGGLQYALYDEKYTRPATGKSATQKKLNIPASWSNEGKGSTWLALKGKSILSETYNGPRNLKQGDVLYYNFALLITPYHTPEKQQQSRLYQPYNKPDIIKAASGKYLEYPGRSLYQQP
ncbi:hypothetical protein SAMN05421788_112114 [Filimonas lacunae]|uniref:Glycoside hydrolase 123-like N-terminal domain-containing protein n=1 Tax=Filimonas lacunae TaxID=477680 RepID=A0A173MLE7_9BACT|nr:glycoside hydrolase domain-containing protein [Filimonas lacunae]BAV08306.1 hypothetical protein FLA_4342 [Filimonas lacunae]SIT33312.1 hypothetical protein SAMN05421788_112114 [Filimonas lacunae]